MVCGLVGSCIALSGLLVFEVSFSHRQWSETLQWGALIGASVGTVVALIGTLALYRDDTKAKLKK